MNTGISPGAKWFTLCLPFFQYLFFHCKFTISISVSVSRCKSKVGAKIVQAERKEKSLLDFLSRGTPNFMRKNIFKDIVRISKINRYFCIID